MFKIIGCALGDSSLGTSGLDVARQMWCVAGVERRAMWGAHMNEIPCVQIVGGGIQIFLDSARLCSRIRPSSV